MCFTSLLYDNHQLQTLPIVSFFITSCAFDLFVVTMIHNHAFVFCMNQRTTQTYIFGCVGFNLSI